MCLMVNASFFVNVHAFSILVVMTNTTLPWLLKFNDATQICELLILHGPWILVDLYTLYKIFAWEYVFPFQFEYYRLIAIIFWHC